MSYDIIYDGPIASISGTRSIVPNIKPAHTQINIPFNYESCSQLKKIKLLTENTEKSGIFIIKDYKKLFYDFS